MFVQDLTKEAYNYTMRSKRKTLQPRDIGMFVFAMYSVLVLALESQHGEYDILSLRSQLY